MAFCPSCGSPAEGRFCQKCGAALAQGATPSGTASYGAVPGPAPVATAAGLEDNVAGALCYLAGFITGILFLVLAPYNQNRTVRFHAFQSIFLHIAWIIAWIAVFFITFPLSAIPIFGLLVSGALHFALWIGGVIVWIYMMFKTYNGEKIVIPVVGPIAEKQAGG